MKDKTRVFYFDILNPNLATAVPKLDFVIC